MRELVGARARVRALEETALVAELFDRPCDVADRERGGGGRGEKLMISDSEKRKQEKFHQGQFHVIYPIMSSASYCQFVISPSSCRVVHVAVMRSFKQTNNKPNVYVWIGGVASEVGRINFICGFEVNTSKISRIYAGRSRTSAISKHQSGGYLFRQARLKKNKDRGVRIRAR